MAGATVHINLNVKPLEEALRSLAAKGGDLGDAFREAGEHLHQTHRARWAKQVSPDGEAWAPLSERYKKRKRKHRNRILLLEDYLRGTLHYQADQEGLKFGTSLIYGATHQFGAEDRGIPARPFLGVDAEDELTILEIIERHILEALPR